MLLEVPADTVRAALQELTFSRADCAAVADVLALREAVAAQLRAALRRTPRVQTRLRWSGSGSLARCAAAKPQPALAAAAARAAAGAWEARRARALLGCRRAGAAAARGGLAEGGSLLQPEGTRHIRPDVAADLDRQPAHGWACCCRSCSSEPRSGKSRMSARLFSLPRRLRSSSAARFFLN